MKFKKWQFISYINEKKKRIYGQIIECGTFNPNMEQMNTVWGFVLLSEPMYYIKLVNGRKVWKFESDQTLQLERDIRKEKITRLLDVC